MKVNNNNSADHIDNMNEQELRVALRKAETELRQLNARMRVWQMRAASVRSFFLNRDRIGQK